jgi:hypothetical protein
MTPVVLAAICLLAWVFLLSVLFQWTRDTKRKATTRPAVDEAAGGTREKTRLESRCASIYREVRPLFGELALGSEQEQSVARLRAWMQRMRAGCL